RLQPAARRVGVAVGARRVRAGAQADAQRRRCLLRRGDLGILPVSRVTARAPAPARRVVDARRAPRAPRVLRGRPPAMAGAVRRVVAAAGADERLLPVFLPGPGRGVACGVHTLEDGMAPRRGGVRRVGDFFAAPALRPVRVLHRATRARPVPYARRDTDVQRALAVIRACLADAAVLAVLRAEDAGGFPVPRHRRAGRDRSGAPPAPDASADAPARLLRRRRRALRVDGSRARGGTVVPRDAVASLRLDRLAARLLGTARP